MTRYTPRKPTRRPMKGDMESAMAPAILGCLGVALMWLLSITGIVVLVWLVIQYGVPWVIDVVMDAVEDRQ